MTENSEYNGSCLCGQVKFKVQGEPTFAGLCHCEVCRRWHNAPINAWAAWEDEKFTILEGKENLSSFRLTEQSHRHWCSNCGAGVFNDTGTPFTAIYVQGLHDTGYTHKPTMHLYYSERTMDINDSLPKFKDFPAELGGSGEMAEQL